MKKNTFIAIAITLVFISIIWIIFSPILFQDTHAEADQQAAHKGFFAPSFTLSTPEGIAHSITDYRGKPVLLFFWASHCSVCKATMPKIESVYQEFSSLGFEVLAINTTNQDSLSAAKAYFQAQNYSFPMLLDQDGTVTNQYLIHAVPTSYLINPDGKISNVIIGSGISDGFLRAQLNTLFMKGEE